MKQTAKELHALLDRILTSKDEVAKEITGRVLTQTVKGLLPTKPARKATR